MTSALGILAIIALILFAIFCAFMDRRRPKPLSDYEIAQIGDRRTADVSNVVDIFGAHSGGAIRP